MTGKAYARAARGIATAAALLTAIAAGAGAPHDAAATAAFARTEVREPCAEHDPLRQPFFGDLHAHTWLSFDARSLGVRTTPADAYRFARGEALGLQPFDADGNPRRRARLRRPLDFAAVTDHAELLGEVALCNTPGAAYGSFMCRLHRRWPLLSYMIVNSAMLNIDDPTRYSFCGVDGSLCRNAALGPWHEIQEAAEEAYDRTAACTFTSFVGYEWSGNPSGTMIHRNVIFRNAAVQETPTSYVEVRTAEGLWERLHAECLDRADGCDAIAIPHNPNLSGGRLFRATDDAGQPMDRATARRRARVERLVEMIQHKGASECRVGSPFGADELCGFELLPFSRMDEFPFESWWTPPARLSYVREALGEGLAQEARLGVNPFQLGLIGSTDTHLGTPGLADEDRFPGHAAGGDTTRQEIPRVPDRLFFNPGGLAVVWAEENSRDALFAAMRRRETYATSGRRMRVRFFGGWGYAETLCESTGLVATGYAAGVPMGGDLPPPPTGAAAPRFVVHAARDPGAGTEPSALLQRIQIVKVWLDDGRPRERVFDVAGDAGNGATVDARCVPEGPGHDHLCALWHDPGFDPAVPALYYARVLENPSCRWSAYPCLREQVRCDAPRTVPDELRYCCAGTPPRTIQERAWTSPIWYTPATPE